MSSCECIEFITDILVKIEFSMDIENTGSNSQLQIKFKSEVKLFHFYEKVRD